MGSGVAVLAVSTGVNGGLLWQCGSCQLGTDCAGEGWCHW